MTEQKTLAARFVELESHLAHQDRMIHDLSDVITAQWDTITALQTKLDRLEALLLAGQEQETASEEPPPPHY